MGAKKKFVIEFDEPPALIFIQEKAGPKCEVYQDGKKVNGIRSVKIYADYDEPTTHEIEYLTGCTEELHTK